MGVLFWLTTTVKAWILNLVQDETVNEKGETSLDTLLGEVMEKVVPGMCNWSHPDNIAWFPNVHSKISLVYETWNSDQNVDFRTLGIMLEHELNCVGFSWSSSPALTELEQLVMDWLVDCFGLPDIFKFSFKGAGGGCLQGLASTGKITCQISWISYLLQGLYLKWSPFTGITQTGTLKWGNWRLIGRFSFFDKQSNKTFPGKNWPITHKAKILASLGLATLRTASVVQKNFDFRFETYFLAVFNACLAARSRVLDSEDVDPRKLVAYFSDQVVKENSLNAYETQLLF